MIECPECAAKMTIAADVEEGEICMCEECGAELEVKTTEPLKLELAPEAQEDWGQ